MGQAKKAKARKERDSTQAGLRRSPHLGSLVFQVNSRDQLVLLIAAHEVCLISLMGFGVSKKAKARKGGDGTQAGLRQSPHLGYMMFHLDSRDQLFRLIPAHEVRLISLMSFEASKEA